MITRMPITPTSNPIRVVVSNVFMFTLMLISVLQPMETELPVRPTYVALEVIAGVLITLLPVAIVRRIWRITSVEVYERLIIAAFLSSGLPILVWQAFLYWL